MMDDSVVNAEAPVVPGILVHPFWMTLDEILQVKIADQIYREAGLSEQVNHWRSDYIARGDEAMQAVSYRAAASILSSLMHVLGPRGGKAILHRTGRRMYEKSIQYMGAFLGFTHDQFTAVPVAEKIGICLTALAETLNSTTPNAAIAFLAEGTPTLSITVCPECWERNSEMPSCYLISGLIEEMLYRATNKHFQVKETSCIATGQPSCDFSIIVK